MSWYPVTDRYVKVNGVWRSVIDAWTKVNGEWREIVQDYVKTEGAPPTGELYSFGVEYVPFVPGIAQNDVTTSKESDHLLLHSHGRDTDVSFVTDVPIDLTNINRLYVDWHIKHISGSTSNTWASALVVSTSKGGGILDYTTRINEQKILDERKVSSVNVSSLSGQYYIRIHDRWAGGTYGETQTRVYRIWGE